MAWARTGYQKLKGYDGQGEGALQRKEAMPAWKSKNKQKYIKSLNETESELWSERERERKRGGV